MSGGTRPGIGLAYTGQCSKKALSINGTFFSWTVG
jgi:hypothetical protein